jgi:predicted nuclease of predicted toxin-antitoxin system
MNSKQAEKQKFLVDVNLPKHFSYFNNSNFLHIADIDPKMSDKKIWNYAIHHNCVILTKDTDFYDLFLTVESHPKVVYFQLGNLTIKELHLYFEKYWPTIIKLLENASFIIAGSSKITVMG